MKDFPGEIKNNDSFEDINISLDTIGILETLKDHMHSIKSLRLDWKIKSINGMDVLTPNLKVKYFKFVKI